MASETPSHLEALPGGLIPPGPGPLTAQAVPIWVEAKTYLHPCALISPPLPFLLPLLLLSEGLPAPWPASFPFLTWQG